MRFLTEKTRGRQRRACVPGLPARRLSVTRRQQGLEPEVGGLAAKRGRNFAIPPESM